MGACLRVATNNKYKIPSKCIIITPIIEINNILKKSVFPFNKVPAKNIAGKKVLGKYLYHFGSCTQCGLCVEACPFGAIEMGQDFEFADFSPEAFEKVLNKKEGRG